MDTNRIVLSGSGGQGVITAAIILAEAAVLHEGLDAVQTQVYGPEARGGATRADVIISTKPIHYPKVVNPNILVCLTQEAYNRFSGIIWPGGLLLTGSAAGLLFAYVVRFLSVSFQTVEASLAKIPPSMDDAARSLGASAGGTLRRIHLPLMRGGLLTACILVFVETMKEMPATLLLRPLGLDTLAIEVWERTSESMWPDAAAPALAIVAAGLLPVFLAIRLSARR